MARTVHAQEIIVYWVRMLRMESRLCTCLAHTVPLSYRQVHRFFKQMLSVWGWPYICHGDGWQILPCLEAISEQKTDMGTLLRGKGLKASLMQMIWTRVKGQGRVSSRQAVSGEVWIVHGSRMESP